MRGNYPMTLPNLNWFKRQYGLYYFGVKAALYQMAIWLVLIFLCLVIAGLAGMAYETNQAWQFLRHQLEHSKKDQARYEHALIVCLNGGIIGKSGNKLVLCDPAAEIKGYELIKEKSNAKL